MDKVAGLMVPAVIALALLRALGTGCDAYGAFLQGAKTGVETGMRLLPVLCAMTLMIGTAEASGLTEALSDACRPALELLHLPRETAPVLLLRPLTGSGSLSALAEIFASCGVDSRAGRIASVLVGSSETIFYTMTVYLGAVSVKRLPYVLPVSLISYLVGAAVAGWLL